MRGRAIWSFILIVLLGFTFSINYLFLPKNKISKIDRDNQSVELYIREELTPTPLAIKPNDSWMIPHKKQYFQTFNNCGPATLAMILSYYNVNVSQEELGLKLRPYQNPTGDNDDKSVTFEELAQESKNYNLIPYHKPNGSLQKLKLFLSNDIPVAVRTWLNPGEDIGHYRVIRGYDDGVGEIVQDDSYHGPHLRYSYEVFLTMWQPFNYEYLVLVTKDKEEVVRQILGEEVDDTIAWKNTLARAKSESQKDSPNAYPVFNQAIAHFHLGNYHETVRLFEEVSEKIPPRMLWYQIQPIRAYLEEGKFDKVFLLTDQILGINNRGFSELYILRGDTY